MKEEIEIKAGYVIHDCECCKGTGYVNSEDYVHVTCKACKGKSKWGMCSSCFGTGRIWTGICITKRSICRKCNGTGKIQIKQFNPVISSLDKSI